MSTRQRREQTSTRIDQARAAMAKRIPKDDPPKEHTMKSKNHRPLGWRGTTQLTRETVDPVVGENGDERHPAFAMIAAARVQHGPTGAALFDSDIRHNHYVTVTLSEATRVRSLNHDRIHPRNRLFEVALSEAQWASFVSSMNTTGVACTLRERPGQPLVADFPYEPRLQESLTEVRGAADKAVAEIATAFKAVQEKPTKANLRTLEAAINNASPNVVFAAKSLNEHAENVVQKARADIEAMVITEAERLGLEPGDLVGGLPALTAGDES